MRRPLKIVAWTGGVIAVLGGLLYGAFYVLNAHFYPDPPAANYPKPATALEAQRQDLDHFRKLTDLDFSYSPQARAEAAHRLDRLAASAEVLPKQKLRVALMQIAALADNGHTAVGQEPDAYPRLLPVRVAPFPDGFYVMYAKSEHAALLGGRILAVDGMPIDEVIRRIETLRGGAENFRRYMAPINLQTQDALYGLGIASDPLRSTWTVERPDGTQVSETLQSYPRTEKEPFAFPERWFANETLKGLDRGWQAYDAGRKPPVSLADFDRHFRRFWLPGSCTLVIQFKSNEDEDGEKIDDFVDATEREMAEKKPCNVIFDNRFNGGGNYTLTAGFAHRLPGEIAPGGHLYLLTSAATFSAGITTTVFIKQSGGDRVTILGEPVGDRMQFFAEGRRGCLPNYHLCMSYQRGMHDYQHPCRDVAKCFWLNWYYQPRVKTLAPDETIAMRFADWKAGRDPVFDRAVALATAK
jgi:hypothetical protein